MEDRRAARRSLRIRQLKRDDRRHEDEQVVEETRHDGDDNEDNAGMRRSRRNRRPTEWFKPEGPEDDGDDDDDDDDDVDLDANKGDDDDDDMEQDAHNEKKNGIRTSLRKRKRPGDVNETHARVSKKKRSRPSNKDDDNDKDVVQSKRTRSRRRIKVIVLGAGISGLACARELRARHDYDIVLLEARHRPGGRLRTIPLQTTATTTSSFAREEASLCQRWTLPTRPSTTTTTTTTSTIGADDGTSESTATTTKATTNGQETLASPTFMPSSSPSTPVHGGTVTAASVPTRLVVPVDVGGALIHGANAPNPIQNVVERLGLSYRPVSGQDCLLFDAFGWAIESRTDAKVQARFNAILSQAMAIVASQKQRQEEEEEGEEEEAEAKPTVATAARPATDADRDSLPKANKNRKRKTFVSPPRVVSETLSCKPPPPRLENGSHHKLDSAKSTSPSSLQVDARLDPDRGEMTAMNGTKALSKEKTLPKDSTLEGTTNLEQDVQTLLAEAENSKETVTTKLEKQACDEGNVQLENSAEKPPPIENARRQGPCRSEPQPVAVAASPQNMEKKPEEATTSTKLEAAHESEKGTTVEDSLQVVSLQDADQSGKGSKHAKEAKVKLLLNGGELEEGTKLNTESTTHGTETKHIATLENGTKLEEKALHDGATQTYRAELEEETTAPHDAYRAENVTLLDEKTGSDETTPLQQACGAENGTMLDEKTGSDETTPSLDACRPENGTKLKERTPSCGVRTSNATGRMENGTKPDGNSVSAKNELSTDTGELENGTKVDGGGSSKVKPPEDTRDLLSESNIEENTPSSKVGSREPSNTLENGAKREKATQTGASQDSRLENEASNEEKTVCDTGGLRNGSKTPSSEIKSPPKESSVKLQNGTKSSHAIAATTLRDVTADVPFGAVFHAIANNLDSVHALGPLENYSTIPRLRNDRENEQIGVRQQQPGPDVKLLNGKRSNCKSDGSQSTSRSSGFGGYAEGTIESDLFRWHTSNLEMSCGAPLDKLGLQWNEDEQWGYGGSHNAVPEGFASVVEALAEQLDIKYGVEVTGVRVVPPWDTKSDEATAPTPDQDSCSALTAVEADVAKDSEKEAPRISEVAQAHEGAEEKEVTIPVRRSKRIKAATQDQETTNEEEADDKDWPSRKRPRGRTTTTTNHGKDKRPRAEDDDDDETTGRRRSKRSNKGLFTSERLNIVSSSTLTYEGWSFENSTKDPDDGDEEEDGNEDEDIDEDEEEDEDEEDDSLVDDDFTAETEDEPFASKVQVETSSGLVLEADHVVCTFPLGILSIPPNRQGHIAFDPPLSPRKRQAIERLGFGHYNKCALSFPYVFWNAADDFMGVVGSPVAGTNVLILNIGVLLDQLPIIVLIYGGSYAQEMEDLDDDEVVSGCMDVLRKIGGGSVGRGERRTGIPDPIDYIVTRWGKDRYSRGAFSYVPPGVEGEKEYEIMSEPVYDPVDEEREKEEEVAWAVESETNMETKAKKQKKQKSAESGAATKSIRPRRRLVKRPVVMFAGEATTPYHPSTIHGAFSSGIREAYRLDFALEPNLNHNIRFNTSFVYKRTFLLKKRFAPPTPAGEATAVSDGGGNEPTLYTTPGSRRRHLRRRKAPAAGTSAAATSTSDATGVGVPVGSAAAAKPRPPPRRKSGRSTAGVSGPRFLCEEEEQQQNEDYAGKKKASLSMEKNGSFSQDVVASLVPSDKGRPFTTWEDLAILRGVDTFGHDECGIDAVRSYMLPPPAKSVDGRRRKRKGRPEVTFRYRQLVRDGADMDTSSLLDSAKEWLLPGGRRSWLAPFYAQALSSSLTTTTATTTGTLAKHEVQEAAAATTAPALESTSLNVLGCRRSARVAVPKVRFDV